MFTVTHQHDDQRGRFLIQQNGQMMAELTYRHVGPRTVNADHTFVDPALRGQKVAEQLLQALVQHAQAHDWRIIPTCSYIAAKLPRSHPELIA